MKDKQGIYISVDIYMLIILQLHVPFKILDFINLSVGKFSICDTQFLLMKLYILS